MKTARCSDAQIMGILKQAEGGIPSLRETTWCHRFGMIFSGPVDLAQVVPPSPRQC